jgi:hypothetical protein
MRRRSILGVPDFILGHTGGAGVQQGAQILINEFTERLGVDLSDRLSAAYTMTLLYIVPFPSAFAGRFVWKHNNDNTDFLFSYFYHIFKPPCLPLS